MAKVQVMGETCRSDASRDRFGDLMSSDGIGVSPADIRPREKIKTHRSRRFLLAFKLKLGGLGNGGLSGVAIAVGAIPGLTRSRSAISAGAFAGFAGLRARKPKRATALRTAVAGIGTTDQNTTKQQRQPERRNPFHGFPQNKSIRDEAIPFRPPQPISAFRGVPSVCYPTI